ncbi:UNVERIFIED_ORG: DNA-binding transcriptional LysR family regulator [Xanthobacter viscosus]|jgi:DNA-binding transcriptional LysR family regulator|uniref:LysR family transcriptional regulator n=1 Tax=Xanthobacter autotrophicus TaxID=280 RepID=A0A6C1KTD9_XANAU|nr:LysR family transcriptional regulator [Xanthobacter autotrophicus]TLX43726.1 LysR family transcriptional regulator [Xanthobacter autotrophicus]
MDTAQLRIFVHVARRGSFAAAARDLDMDASAVSRAVAALEAELDARLMHRTTRTMSLTEAGLAYLARVEPILDELDRARDEVASARAEPVGTLRLTASVAFGEACLMPLLPEMRMRFPRLKLDLILTDANLDLAAERIDMALRLAPDVRADVIGVKLFATRYRVVASPDYCMREGTPSTPQEVEKHPAIVFGLPDFRLRWLFRRDGRVEEVPVRGDIAISSGLAIRHAAHDGLGLALLPDWLVGPDLAAGRLIDLFPDHDITATSFDTAAWLIYASRRYTPKKVRLMTKFLRERLGRPG